MTEFYRLLEANKDWVRKTLALNPTFFQSTSETQTPEFLWIGCSDSRVPAEEITGCSPGQLFVHRNIANLVVHTDFNLLSVLQYAVEVLKVKHVILCGHYGCGGILNAMSNKHLGLINKWLRHIKDVYRFHAHELDEIKEFPARYRRLVELNVLEQIHNLAETSIIQNSWNHYQAPTLHGWVYDMETGYISELASIEASTPLEQIYRYDMKEHTSDISEDI
jgi:carbonic anhydrase